MIRIANGQGFCGDSVEAPLRLVEQGGHVDALIDPLATRRVLTFALETTMYSKHAEHTVLERM